MLVLRRYRLSLADSLVVLCSFYEDTAFHLRIHLLFYAHSTKIPPFTCGFTCCSMPILRRFSLSLADSLVVLCSFYEDSAFHLRIHLLFYAYSTKIPPFTCGFTCCSMLTLRRYRLSLADSLVVLCSFYEDTAFHLRIHLLFYAHSTKIPPFTCGFTCCSMPILRRFSLSLADSLVVLCSFYEDTAFHLRIHLLFYAHTTKIPHFTCGFTCCSMLILRRYRLSLADSLVVLCLFYEDTAFHLRIHLLFYAYTTKIPPFTCGFTCCSMPILRRYRLSLGYSLVVLCLFYEDTTFHLRIHLLFYAHSTKIPPFTCGFTCCSMLILRRYRLSL